MNDYDVETLKQWEEKIREKALEIGLDFYEQEFELIDYDEMISYQSYSGMPSHYPHWSFGKAYERTRSLYDHGLTGLPYEMVINSNPSIAYLMKDNSLLLQILTMAHVYGHNDFFKNNCNFAFTQAQNVVSRFKNHADRIREFSEDPSIGLESVEKNLDAAHSIMFNCERYPHIKKLTTEETKNKIMEQMQTGKDEFAELHEKPESQVLDLNRIPLEPEENLLLFIRDYCPYMEEWEKELLTIVHETSRYFIPQIETKIMNEGWASYMHYRILNELDLTQGLHVEFLKRHNQVIRPHVGGLNPYHMGFKIFEDIEKRWNDPSSEEKNTFGRTGGQGLERIFHVREVDRDVSFIRQYLTEELIREFNLFEYVRDAQQNKNAQQKTYVISETADKRGWKKIKETLLMNVGLNTFPVIKILDANYNNEGSLLLQHEYDGRELHMQYAENTLKNIHTLWRRPVILKTHLEAKPVHVIFGRDEQKVRIAAAC